MDVLTRIPTEEEGDIFSSFMADLEFPGDLCPDLPSPQLVAEPHTTGMPAKLQIPDSFRHFPRLDSLDLHDTTPAGLHDCLESPSLHAALFNLGTDLSMDLDLCRLPSSDYPRSYMQLLGEAGSDKMLTDMFNTPSVNTVNSARSSSHQSHPQHQSSPFEQANTSTLTSSSDDALLDCMTTNGFGHDSTIPTPSTATSFHPHGIHHFPDGQGSNGPSTNVSTSPSPLSFSPYPVYPQTSQPDPAPMLSHPPSIRCHVKERSYSSSPSPPPMIHNSQFQPSITSPQPCALESLLSPSLDAMDIYNAQMLDPTFSTLSSPWDNPSPLAENDDFRRQSESGSSSLHPTRTWQPVAQRKAVKRALSRARNAPNNPPHLPPHLDTSFYPTLPAISTSLPKAFIPAGLQEQPSDDSAYETPTAASSAQTEWLRIQMTKLMTSSPNCVPVPLRNLMNSPRRANSQPNSPSFRMHTPRGKNKTPGSRPGTPKARTPRGTSAKAGSHPFLPVQFAPSRLGTSTSSPPQRHKVARSQNTDVSSSSLSQSLDENERANSPFKPPRASEIFASALAEQMQIQIKKRQQQQKVAAAVAAAATQAAATAALPVVKTEGLGEEALRMKASWETYLGMMDVDANGKGMEDLAQEKFPIKLEENSHIVPSDSHSRPQSSNSNRSSSSPAPGPPLEHVLEQVSGNCLALEQGGRLLQLQRSFPSGLPGESLELILLALAQHPTVEVVYFPDTPMVLGEQHAKLLAAALQQGRIWALSLGEGGSMTAGAWQLLANRLQTTALAYLYVSPMTQATIPPVARTQIRDALHQNRRSTPCRDSALLEHMQRMTPQAQQQQAQQQAEQQAQAQANAQQQQQGGIPAAATHGLSLSSNAGVPRQNSPDSGSDVSSQKPPPPPQQSHEQPQQQPHSPLPAGALAAPSGHGASAPHTLVVAANNLTAPPSALTSPSSVSPDTTVVTDLPDTSRTSSAGAPPAAARAATVDVAAKRSRPQQMNTSQSSGSASLDDVCDTANKRSPKSPGDPSFADLVAVGLVQPGHYHLSVGAVRSVNVAVLPKGAIQWEGVEYLSLTAFAMAVFQRSNTSRMSSSCDGWKEVCLHGISLETLRQHYVERNC